MSKGIVAKKVWVASLLVAGCGGTVEKDESAPEQVRQTLRSDSSMRPKLATGRFHNVALKADGSVWAWGLNTDMQLGDTTTTDRWSPVQVQGLTGTIVSVAAGLVHSMALRDDGTVLAWGDNAVGQTGATGTTDQAPVQVPNLSNVVAVDGGGMFSVALESDGDVWTWGSNYYCQLGNWSYSNSATPVRVQTADASLPYLNNVVAISAGVDFALAVRQNDTQREVWAWGRNNVGQLGDGTTTERCRAVKLTTLPNVPSDPNDPNSSSAVVVDVSAGYNHSLALLSNGSVLSWGNNAWGQLGTGGYTDAWGFPVPTPGQSSTPLLIPNLGQVTKIDAGAYGSMAVDASGNARSWGANVYAQRCIGVGPSSDSQKVMSPVLVPNLGNFSHVTNGENFSAAMFSDGSVRTCGIENYGALGYDLPGTNSSTNTLTSVSGFP